MVLNILSLLKLLFFKTFRSHAVIIAENIALRHQLTVLKRTVKRPRISKRDRVLWIWLSRVWCGWKTALFILKPETVIKWHRQGFKLYWRLRSKHKPGRPGIDYKIITLIHRMSRENSTWGAPRIQSELMLLGYNIAESTVAKYMTKGRKPPSQTWRTF